MKAFLRIKIPDLWARRQFPFFDWNENTAYLKFWFSCKQMIYVDTDADFGRFEPPIIALKTPCYT